eukprot:m.106515 g.106515  ORF g.106515 m.106515 type:complete len:114 (-) comp12674_c0_seq9:896-1237(-)
MKLWPPLSTLVRSIVTWAKSINITWTSYLLTLYTIRFMQVHYRLPSLQAIANMDGYCPECTEEVAEGGDGPTKRHKETSLDCEYPAMSSDLLQCIVNVVVDECGCKYGNIICL